jgi:hypothetical protein|tara:strand:- start:218 stop:649 length:432 start_codon:yes stop_codon:yes gene_type:complete
MADGMKMIGHIAEAYVVYALSKLGVEAFMVKQDGIDVVALRGPGVLVAQRIEVKGATYNDKNLYSFSCSKGKPKRSYTKQDCDIIALVGLLDDGVSFKAVEELQQVTKKIHRRDYQSNDITERTWNKALAKSLQSTKKLLEGI